MAYIDEILKKIDGELGVGSMTYEPYIAPDQFQQDCEKIFNDVWLCIGRIEEVSDQKQYIVRDVPVWNSSVVAIRQKDGSLRAFHNVCTHRGNKLVWDDDKIGPVSKLVCKFHGWVFDRDGSLVGAPEANMFAELDKKACGLKEVSVDLWNGFIFVHASRAPSESLRQYLGKIAENLDDFPFGKYTTVYRYQMPLKCNWRILRDSQLEGYHAKFLHRRSLPNFLTNRDNPSIHVVDAEIMGRHAMAGLYRNTDLKPTPTQIAASRYGTFVDNRKGDSGDNAATGINRSGSNNWAFDLYFVYPNLHIIVMSDMVLTHNMIPVSQTESIWEATAYYEPANTGAEYFAREYGKATIRDTWFEDGSTLENTQFGLSSRVLDKHQLQSQEFMIRVAERENERRLSA